MKLTRNVYPYFVSLIYLSFAFDSLLKIKIGVKIHVGILLILCLNLFFFLNTKSISKCKIDKSDIWLILFGAYILISGIIKTGINSLFLFFYFFLALNVYYFLSKNKNI